MKFQPGQSGNPSGRPKGAGISITTEIKRKLEEMCEDDKGNKATYLQKLIDKIMDKAVKDGDQRTIDKIWAYIDGLPKESLTVDGDLNFKWKKEDSEDNDPE